MKNYQYYVKKQGNTTFITKELLSATLEDSHFGNDTATFVCDNIWDATEIAEALIVLGDNAVDNKYKGLFLYVDVVMDLEIYVSHVQAKNSEAGSLYAEKEKAFARTPN